MHGDLIKAGLSDFKKVGKTEELIKKEIKLTKYEKKRDDMKRIDNNCRDMK